MADEQYIDLSSDTKRVDYFNKQVEEYKKTKPEVAELSPVAFDMAKQYSLQRTFPPFGLISFPEEPGNPLGDPNKIKGAAEKVIFGTANFVKSLKSDSPETLIQRGIDTYKGFYDSTAVNSLLGSTKMSFANIRQGLEEVNDAIKADDPNPDDPFEGKAAFKNLKPEDISALLSSTVIKFIKEIGLKREDESNDNKYLENADKALSKIPKEETTTKSVDVSKLNTAEDPEYMERMRKAREEDDLLNSLDISKSGAKIATSKPKTEAKPEGIKSIETPVTPPPATPATPAPTTESAPPTQIKETNLNLEKEEEKTTPIQPATQTGKTGAENTQALAKEEEVPTVTQTAQAPVTETGKTNTGGTGINFEDNPMLSEFGKALGFSAADMQEVFGGSGADEISKGLREGITGRTSEPVTNTVKETTPEAVKTQEPAPATKVSEPAKIATSAPAATPPPPPAQAQEKTTASEPEKPAGESTPAPPPPAAEEKKDETKAAEETKKEEDKTNAELLKVMKDILRTLQGPLITTDGTHKFH